jgi:hypothetical protein
MNVEASHPPDLPHRLRAADSSSPSWFLVEGGFSGLRPHSVSHAEVFPSVPPAVYGHLSLCSYSPPLLYYPLLLCPGPPSGQSMELVILSPS